MALQFSYPDISKYPDFDNHETILEARDRNTGFHAFIAVHNTSLGPARGGCRYWPHYRNASEAISDVLKLSRGMTYKSAMANLPYGGGKTVIIGQTDAKKPDQQTMHALGHMLNELNKNGEIYETGEDVGTNTSDFKIAGEITDYVRVKSFERAGAIELPGGPPLYTAHGVFYAMKAAAKHKLNYDNLRGVRVAIKGLGNVARPLCDLLHKDGAQLIVADLDPAKVEDVVKNCNARAVGCDEIMSQDCDIYAPCALGGDIGDDMIANLKASMIVGAANNQLQSQGHAQILHERDILYAPDYAVNAGGVVNVVLMGLNHDQLINKVSKIENTLLDIFTRSKTENINTSEIADMIVRERLRMKAADKNGFKAA